MPNRGLSIVVKTNVLLSRWSLAFDRVIITLLDGFLMFVSSHRFIEYRNLLMNAPHMNYEASLPAVYWGYVIGYSF